MSTTLLPLFYVLLCMGVGHLGRNRKFGFWVYFICSFLLTPLIGLLLVLASDPRRRR